MTAQTREIPAVAKRATGDSPLAKLANLPRSLRRVTASNTYVPQIDGLRFLAIMPVLLWHAAIRGHRVGLGNAGLSPAGEPAWMPVGEIGVQLFFFISGYIIAYPFITAAAAGTRPDIGAFFRRRLTRLEPPYILMLVICLLLVLASGGTGGINPGREAGNSITPVTSFLASLFYLHAPVLQKSPILNPPVWSLEVEIQFYILAPLLLRGFLAIRGATMRHIVGLAAVAAAMVAAQVIQAELGRWHWANYTLAAHAWGFLLGVLVSDIYAGVRARGEQRPSGTYDAVFFAGLAAFLLSGFFDYHGEPLPGLICNAVRALAFVAMFWGSLRGTRTRGIVGAPWIALIGGACYSIYLTHVPVMVIVAKVMYAVAPVPGYAAPVLLAIVTLIPIGIAVGLVYYAFVERPCMDPRWPGKLVARLRGTRREA